MATATDFAAGSTTSPETLQLALLLLVEFLQVQLHDVLNKRVHLLLVLHDLCDVNNLLLLKVTQEVLQVIENLLILFAVDHVLEGTFVGI